MLITFSKSCARKQRWLFFSEHSVYPVDCGLLRWERRKVFHWCREKKTYWRCRRASRRKWICLPRKYGRLPKVEYNSCSASGRHRPAWLFIKQIQRLRRGGGTLWLSVQLEICLLLWPHNRSYGHFKASLSASLVVANGKAFLDNAISFAQSRQPVSARSSSVATQRQAPWESRRADTGSRASSDMG